VGTARPTFSWVPVAGSRGEEQTAYRLLVASGPGLLFDGRADLWDSGVVASDAVSGVGYDGRPLESRERCWWSVQLWDRNGDAGAFSEPATFELGLLDADDWRATWIGDHVIGGPPLLRREFEIPGDVRRARAYVTGLGYYELRLNGEKVGDRVLDPAQTSYSHAEDLRGPTEHVRIRTPRVIYAVFDITEQLRRGANAVGLILGNGWYSASDNWIGRQWADRPRGLVQLEIELEDGARVVVASDESWRVAAGPIVSSSHVHGEDYDARLEHPGWDQPGFADTWAPALPLPAPDGVLSTAMIEPIRVTETLAPVEIVELRDGVRIVDFGQHISGWTRIRVTAPAGGRVTLRHAGEIDGGGELEDRANINEGLAPARQTDVYTSAGGSAEWEPRFTLHGFRYVEVTTTPGVALDGVDARVVHSDVAAIGSFECSNELLNRIDSNVRWTYRASMQGYPQDAPDRSERVGWLGDPGWIIEDYLYQFDTIAFWAKWLDDIRDAQLDDGTPPIVAPVHSPASFMDTPDWATAYPVIAWQVYIFSGDRTILERHYRGMKDVLDWFSGFAVDGIVSAGFGDHMEPQPDGTCQGEPLNTPVDLTSTAWWYRTADIVASTAELLGEDDAESIRALAESIRASFTRAFFDEATATYGPGNQTSLALPLWFGLVPAEHRDRVAANLIEQITGPDRSHLTTGTMGTAALEQVLADVGGADAMYDLATQTDYPSWGDQIRQGATTVWEAWGGNLRWPQITDSLLPTEDGSEALVTSSRSMKLLAAVSKFLYKDVAGISPTAPGWARIRVRPALTHRLAHASARTATPRGEVAIAWRRESGRLEIELTVPSTSVADVVIPVGAFLEPVLSEGERTLWSVGDAGASQPGIAGLRRSEDELRLEAGGGTYRFVVTERTEPVTSPSPDSDRSHTIRPASRSMT
jgi:alpha-L-rhamnosidase